MPAGTSFAEPGPGMVAYDPCGGIPDGGNKQTIQNYCNAAKAADEAGSTHKKVALVWSAVAVVCTAECAAAMSGGMFFGMPYNGIVCPIAGLSGSLLEMHFNSKLKDDLKNLQQAFLFPDRLHNGRFFASGQASYLEQTYTNGFGLSKEDVFRMALGIAPAEPVHQMVQRQIRENNPLRNRMRERRIRLLATAPMTAPGRCLPGMPCNSLPAPMTDSGAGIATGNAGAAPVPQGATTYDPFGNVVPAQPAPVPQGAVSYDPFGTPIDAHGNPIPQGPAAAPAAPQGTGFNPSTADSDWDLNGAPGGQTAPPIEGSGPAPAAAAQPAPAGPPVAADAPAVADAPPAPQAGGGPLGPELPETNDLPELGKSTSVTEGGGDAAAGGGTQAATAAGPGAFETAMVCAAAAMTIYKTYTNFKAIDKDKATAKENRDAAHRLRQSALFRSPGQKFSQLFAGLLRKLDSISWIQSAVAAVREAAVAFVSPFTAESCNDGPGGLLSCARKADPSIPLGVVSPLFVQRFEKISKHGLREYVLQQEISSPALALRQGLGPSVNPNGINNLGLALSRFEAELPQLMASIEPQLENLKANPVAMDSSRLDIKAMQKRLMALQKPSSFADLANSAVAPRAVAQPQRQPASEISQGPQNLFELVSARYRKCASRVVQLEPASPYNRYTQGLKSK